MRVLHVISSIDTRAGGPSAALQGLAEAQARAGLDVTVLSTFEPGELLTIADRLSHGGVNVHLIGPTIGKLGRHRDLSLILRQVIAQADILHVHALWEESQHLACRLAQEFDKPYVVRACGMLDPWSLGRSRVIKQAYLWWRLRENLDAAAGLHFTTDTESRLADPLGLGAPSIVIPNGIDLSEFASLPPRGAFRARHRRIGDRPMILFLGRVHPGKGLEYLVPALQKVTVPGAVLVIVGPDIRGFQAHVQALVRRFQLEDRVVFAGMLTGVERVAALADADLFALPSDHENFGVAVVEALAAGVPVVVSDQVQIHEEVRRAGVGGVCGRGVEDLAGELSRWLSDPALRGAAAAKARPFVWERYSWERIALRWSDEYRRLIVGHDAATAPAPPGLRAAASSGAAARFGGVPIPGDGPSRPLPAAGPSPPLHVLHVIAGIAPESGGPTTAVAGLAAAQVRAGMTVTIAASFHHDPHPPTLDRLLAAGIGVQMIGPITSKLTGHPDLTPRLAALTQQAQVVHIHGVWDFMLHQAARVARGLGRPYVVTAHGMLDPWSLRQKPVRKWLYMTWRLRAMLHRAAAIHFTTDIERDLAAALAVGAPSVVLPLGVDLAEFAHLPPPGAFRARFPQLGQRPVIAYLGRIHPGKGLEYLVPAMRYVRPAEAVLAVIGPDSRGYRRHIEALAAQNGVEQRVVFTGMLGGADRIAALADADLFALPSDHENFGIVVLEALAAGTPVLVSDQVQLYRHVVNAGVGEVCGRRPAELAGAINRWLADPALRRAAADNGRRLVWDTFDWLKIAQDWHAVYAGLAQRATVAA